MYLHYVRKSIPCCLHVCTFLRIIPSVFLFQNMMLLAGILFQYLRYCSTINQLMNTSFLTGSLSV